MIKAAPVTVVDLLQIVDIRTKIVSLSSLAIGTSYAVYTTHAFSIGLFVAMLLATLLVDMGTTGFNSYYDFLHGVDTVDTDAEKSKALVQRGIEPAVALRLSWFLFVLAAALGLVIGALVDWRIVLVGGACMTVALLYSGGPVPIARLPVGEIFAGGLLGLVLIATILSVNNACDIEGDAKAGRRTVAILLGRDNAERVIHLQAAVTLLLGYALVPLRVLPVSALLPMTLAGLFGWRELARMHRRGFSHRTKAPSMGGISAVFVVYTLAILVAIGMGASGLP